MSAAWSLARGPEPGRARVWAWGPEPGRARGPEPGRARVWARGPEPGWAWELARRCGRDGRRAARRGPGRRGGHRHHGRRGRSQRRAKLGDALEAILRAHLQRPLDRVGGARRDPGETREGEGRMVARVAPAEQVVQGRPQGVDIRTGRGQALVLLGWRVARGADLRHPLLGLKDPGDPEVNHLQRPGGLLEHHIRGLHIAVDQALVVEILQHIAELIGPF